MFHHLLRCLHNVPAAAVIHVRPFLRLLTEAHHRVGAFAKLSVKSRHEGVRRSRPVAVRMTSVSVVTAVTHVAVTLQHIRHVNSQILVQSGRSVS